MKAEQKKTKECHLTVNFIDQYPHNQRIELKNQVIGYPPSIWMNLVDRNGEQVGLCMSPEEALALGRALYKIAYASRV